MNICVSCKQDFAGVRDFDSHRVGKHAYTFMEGLRIGKEDGRRCLAPDELVINGWKQNTRGRWVHAREGRRRVVFAPERVRVGG